MRIREYIQLVLSQCGDKTEIKFDIGVDSWGEVDQSSENRVRFTVTAKKKKL